MSLWQEWDSVARMSLGECCGFVTVPLLPQCCEDVTVTKMSLWQEWDTVAKESLWEECHCGEDGTLWEDCHCDIFHTSRIAPSAEHHLVLRTSRIAGCCDTGCILILSRIARWRGIWERKKDARCREDQTFVMFAMGGGSA